MRDVVLVIQHTHDWMAAISVDLGSVGIFQTHHVSSKLDESALKTETDAEIGDLSFAGIAHGFDLAGDAAIAEAAGNEDPVHPAQALFRAFALDVFRLDLADQYSAVRGNA